MKWARLNLDEIAATIESVKELRQNPEQDEPLTVDAARRLLDGYGYVEELLSGGVDIFRYGGSAAFLELNTRVLCGVTPDRRVQFAKHLAETERWFYDVEGGNFGDTFDWINAHRGRSPHAFAAGIFVRLVSTPQLFIEGNRRTATLLASYVLASAGLPPMVVPAHLFGRYEALSGLCYDINRQRGLVGSLAVLQAEWRMEGFLVESQDERFLALRAAETPSGG